MEDSLEFMNNVRYLDVDTHSSHGLLKFGGMKDLTLVTGQGDFTYEDCTSLKYMADTIQWLKVELYRGREEGGCPHVRLASFVEPQYICRPRDRSIYDSPYEGHHWREVPDELWDRWVAVGILPRMSSRAWRKTGQSPTIFEVLLS
jgi:transposase